jgi:hypothetical protein
MFDHRRRRRCDLGPSRVHPALDIRSDRKESSRLYGRQEAEARIRRQTITENHISNLKYYHLDIRSNREAWHDEAINSAVRRFLT